MAAPTDVTGLDSWYKASSLTGLADGDLVASWPDSSGNGFTATQGTPAACPIYKTAILNGQPALRFDGVDDGLDSAASTSLGETTVFVVMRINNVAGGNRSTPRGASANGGMQFRTDAGKAQLVNQGVAAMGLSTSAGVTSATHNVMTASFSDSGNAVAFYLNGTAGGTATYSTSLTAARTTAIGRNGSNGADRMNGDLLELIAYSKVLSAAERATVHSYVQDTYGITVSDYTSGGGTPPTVNAGADQTAVEPWATVTLTATSSEATVTWSQLTGTTVTLSGSGLSRTFTAPATIAGQTLTFRASATSAGGTTTDDVAVTVLPVTERAAVGGVEVPLRIVAVAS